MVLGIEGNYPEDGTASGYIISLILIVIALTFLVISKKPADILRIERVRFVDTLMRVQIAVCVVMGILHTVVLGDIALYLFVCWSVFTGIVYLTFVLKKYRFIGQFEPLVLPPEAEATFMSSQR